MSFNFRLIHACKNKIGSGESDVKEKEHNVLQILDEGFLLYDFSPRTNITHPIDIKFDCRKGGQYSH